MKKTINKFLFGMIAATLAACGGAEVNIDKGTISHAGSPQILTLGAGYLKGVVYYPPDPFTVNMSSVSMKNGKYSIDSIIIQSNANKKQLVAALDFDKLEEKKTVSEIPLFIKTFLDSVSGKGNFDIVNKGEPWQEDWLTLGKDLPAHQLVYFASGKHMALFSFYTGGAHKTQSIALLKFYGDKIVDFWFDAEVDPASSKEAIMKDLKSNWNKQEGC